MMETIQLPSHNTPAYKFKYNFFEEETFKRTKTHVYFFLIGEGGVCIYRVLKEEVFIYFYYRKWLYCGYKNLHNHSTTPKYYERPQMFVSDTIIKEIDKVKDNMPIKRKPMINFMERIY